MEHLIYYVAVFLTIAIAGYGVLLILLSVFWIISGLISRRSNQTLFLNSVHFVNGTLNLFLGLILFWLVEPNDLSSYSTVAIVVIFSLLERFVRNYYTERLESKS